MTEQNSPWPGHLRRISTLERVVGIIESARLGVNPVVADMLETAVVILDDAIKELKDGK